MLITLSPKKRFQAKKDAVKIHQALVGLDTTAESLQAALAQMVIDQPAGTNPAQSWDNVCRLDGARRFIDIWLNLTETPEPPKRTDHNLTD